MHMLFGALVLETFLLFPPRWPRRTRPNPRRRWSLYIGGNLCGAVAVLCLALAVRLMLNPTRVGEDASEEQQRQAEVAAAGEQQLAVTYDKIAGFFGALGLVACMASMRYTRMPTPAAPAPAPAKNGQGPPEREGLPAPAPAKADTGQRLTP
jgi:hypothetical protein